mgnify:CR=1 FL=1
MSSIIVREVFKYFLSCAAAFLRVELSGVEVVFVERSAVADDVFRCGNVDSHTGT